MDISEKTFRDIIKETSLAGRKQLKMLVGLILALSGGGGAWMYSTHGQITDQISGQQNWVQVIDRQVATIERHDRALTAQEERVEAIAILLVQQGRYFEGMVRSVAPADAKFPERPTALDAIEQQILRRGAQRAN